MQIKVLNGAIFLNGSQLVYVHRLLWAKRVYTFIIIYYEKKVFKH